MKHYSSYYSAVSISSIVRAFLLLFWTSNFPVVKADCWFDSDRNEHCTLSTAARIGIGIAIIVAFVVLFTVLGYMRRRRMLRANQAFVASQPNPYTNQYPYGNSMYDPTNAGVNQYPPQSGPFPRSTNWYEGGYNMQTAYAPPEGPPPGVQPQPPPQYSSVEPPRNPPPVKS